MQMLTERGRLGGTYPLKFRGELMESLLNNHLLLQRQ